MSDDELYYSEESNLLSETPASSTNDFTYEQELEQQEIEQEYIYDYEYQSNEYIVYEEEQVQEIPYIIPKPSKKIIWKRPNNSNQQVSKSRKRQSVTEDKEPPPSLDFHGVEPPTEDHLSPPSKKSQTQMTDKAVVNFYLQDIRKRSESFKPKRPKDRGEDIFERLEQAGNCDIRNRQCIHPTCNRRFISIEVLAYHISYAHQQYSGKMNNDTQICLVCGIKFTTGQGKLSHMTSTHKELANEHGRLCLLQGPNTVVL